MNYPGGGKGRSLLFDGHAIAWSKEPFDHIAAERDLNGSRAWRCDLGAAPVKIIPIKNTKRDLVQTAYYLIKMPHSAKIRSPKKGKPGEFRLRDVIKGYRSEFAFRTFEGLTQMKLIDTLFGVGDGKALRQNVRRELERWHRSRSTAGTIVPANFDTWAFWFRLRRQLGSANLLPYRFDQLAAPAKAPRAPKPVKQPPKPRRPHSKMVEAARRRGRTSNARLGLRLCHPTLKVPSH